MLPSGVGVTLDEAFLFFRRLGVDVQSLSRTEFTTAYFDLAWRFHPDRNSTTSELMANINAAGVRSWPAIVGVDRSTWDLGPAVRRGGAPESKWHFRSTRRIYPGELKLAIWPTPGPVRAVALCKPGPHPDDAGREGEMPFPAVRRWLGYLHDAIPGVLLATGGSIAFIVIVEASRDREARSYLIIWGTVVAIILIVSGLLSLVTRE